MSENRLIIDFRGTESQKDAATDINAKQKYAHFLPREFRQHQIKVHAGFLTQYDSTRQLVRDYAMVKQWRYAYPEILVTGHSNGLEIETFGQSRGQKCFLEPQKFTFIDKKN